MKMVSITKLNRILFLFFLGGMFWSCSNPQSWTYKQWHNTLAHYNKFFNAEQKWLETFDNVRDNAKEDFRQPIELFNYGTVESLQGNLAAMDDVIKRASTMIDRHPKSKWVDDAYHLTAKAYLLKGDVNAAIDLFEFVNSQFTNPEIKYLSKLWTVRALLLKGKIIDAEALAESLLNNKELPKSLYTTAQFTLGAIYHKQKKYTQSAELLEKALPKLTNRMDKYRTYFALGQAYQKLGKFDKAELAYSKIPRYNPPYELTFNAQIAQVEILSVNSKNYQRTNKILNSMLRDDKNIEYKGQIYYRMALNELNAGKQPKAIETLKTSVRYSQQDAAQRTTSYLKLGDLYFGSKSYEIAGLYYDSANKSLDEKHPDFEKILAKNAQLGDLLTHLVRIKNNDSLLRMVTDRNFKNEKIKQAIQAEKDLAKLAEKKSKAGNAPKPGFGGGLPNPNLPDAGMGGGGSSFPFYNFNTRKSGMATFQQMWGNRPNSNFWRYNAKIMAANNSDTAASENGPATNKVETIDSNLLAGVSAEERKYYLGLPLTPLMQKTLIKEIEESHFKLAEIYQNRLNEPLEAIFYNSALLSRFPLSTYKPQTLYNLIKLYGANNNEALATQFTDTLQQKFPESIYLKMLKNPNTVEVIRSTNNESNIAISAKYDSMVLAFQLGNYKEAISIKLATDKKYSGNSLQPRFDFVYAVCLLRLDDAKAIPILEQLIADYPNSDVSEKAKTLIEAYQRIKNPIVVDSALLDSANALYVSQKASDPLNCLLIVPKGSNLNLIKSAISDLNKKEFSLENMLIGQSVVAGSKYLILIENFENPEKAKFYRQFLLKQQSYFSGKGLFEYSVVCINPENFIRLSKSFDWQSYMDWFEKENQ